MQPRARESIVCIVSRVRVASRITHRESRVARVRADGGFVLFRAAVARSNAAPVRMPKSKPKPHHPNSVHLTVASVARAVRFYEEKLGFKAIDAFPADKPVWAKVVLGGQVVMLGELPSLQEARQFGMDHAEIEVLKQDARAFARGGAGVGVAYYLQVDDVDAYARKLKKRRVKPLLPPKTQVYGLRDLHLVDLDGYRLVFYAPAEPPAAAGGPATG
jgi:uncharacterized glyoxalase superfamily protein PhnB